MKLCSIITLLAASTCASAWSIGEGSYAVIRGGNAIVEGKLSNELPAVDLDMRSTLQLSLTPSEQTTPHQISLTLRDPVSGLSLAYPATLKKKQATIKISHQKIPAALQGIPLELRLIVASFEGEPYSEVLTTQFHADRSGSYQKPARLGALPEIKHIFKPNPKTVMPEIALLVSMTSFSLYVGLLGVLVAVGGNFSALGDALGGSVLGHLGLLGSLAGLELTFFLYFIDMSVFDALTYAALIAPVALFAGSRALREVNERRLAGKFL